MQNFTVDCIAQVCPDGPLGAAGASNKYCGKVEQSEVDSIVVWHPTAGVAPTNWGPSMVLADFDIDNTDATDAKQKRFFGKGNTVAPEIIETTTNNFQVQKINGTYTLNFILYDVDIETRDYFRKIECGSVKPLLLYTTVAGNIFGGDNGLRTTKFGVSMPLDEGEESIEQIVLEIQWRDIVSPDKFPSPLE